MIRRRNLVPVLISSILVVAPSLVSANIQQEIHDAGGISGTIYGFATIIILFIVGYPILYVMNFLRILKASGLQDARNRCQALTGVSLGTYIEIAALSVFFIIPFSLLPFGILLLIATVLSHWVFQVPFGRIDPLKVILIYTAVAYVSCLAYALYRGLSASKNPLVAYASTQQQKDNTEIEMPNQAL